jgi:DNA-directed RNA polymerase specialized sigma24 family protein
VVALRVHRDLPYAEIARFTGCTENAAKVNFHHALKRLRRALADDAADRGAFGPGDARGAASKETFA